jgi:hypothetical protein
MTQKNTILLPPERLGTPSLTISLGSLAKALGNLAVMYGIAIPIIGLLHMIVLYVHKPQALGGGSNHLFVPTGLLFDWFEHAPLDTNMGNVFGGGLVRVD